MIRFSSKNCLEAYKKMLEGLAFGYGKHSRVTWGLCGSFDESVTVEISNILDDADLGMDANGFTHARWTRFQNSYLRPDYEDWIKGSIERMERNPRKPSVTGYIMNWDTGHNFGSCLQSVNFRLFPTPEIYMTSRATQIDRAGICDLALLHVTAKAIVKHATKDVKKIKARWNINQLFISAITQTFCMMRWGYLKRLRKNKYKFSRAHFLRSRIIRFIERNVETGDPGKFGVSKRTLVRIEKLKKGTFARTREKSLFRNLELYPGRTMSRRKKK